MMRHRDPKEATGAHAHAHHAPVQHQREEDTRRDAQEQGGHQVVRQREGGMSAGDEQAVDAETQRHKEIVEAEGLHIHHAVLHQLRFPVEQGDDLPGEKPGEDEDPHADDKGDAGACPAGPDRPVPPVCADVLGTHGGDGGPQRHRRHDGKSVELGHHAHGGRGVHPADVVGEHRDDEKGEAGHAVLHRCGKAQPEDTAYIVPVDAQRPWLEVKDEIVPGQRHHAQHHAQALREHGGHSRAQRAHVEHRHQDIVQHNIGHTGDEHEIERPLGVAHTPLHSAEHVVGKDK